MMGEEAKKEKSKGLPGIIFMKRYRRHRSGSKLIIRGTALRSLGGITARWSEAPFKYDFGRKGRTNGAKKRPSKSIKS